MLGAKALLDKVNARPRIIDNHEPSTKEFRASIKSVLICILWYRVKGKKHVKSTAGYIPGEMGWALAKLPNYFQLLWFALHRVQSCR